MKIEKISDNQIRCTLNKSDLIDRELKISELAYGTEKAKALFRDMIQQAFYEFGFEVDDIPLMIEAIPVSTECLILVITKVSDPDELDTRFSKFSSFNINDNDKEEADEDSYADEIISSFDQSDEEINEVFEENAKESQTEANNVSVNEVSENISTTSPSKIIKIYSFHSLREVAELSSILLGIYNGINTLYKNPVNSTYFLVISITDHTPEEFNKICNIISEYGKVERFTYASASYYEEHYEIIVKDHALQILSVM